jgi:voltage-gated potassium channel
MLGVIKERKPELVAAVGMLSCLLVLAASVIYYAERQVQPEAFSSIPAAMWWAIATLTTVGYGDVYPVTATGRLFGAVTAVAGLLIVALPTGILGAGFVSAFEEERAVHLSDDSSCPTCDRPFES